MAKPLSALLTPENGLIFRITHRDNLQDIIANGVHCWNSAHRNPHFVAIGNGGIIERREHRAVEVSPGGTLGDYIPFYLTPRSPMHMNILTGRGVPILPAAQIVVLVSSLSALEAHGIPFVMADRNASYEHAAFGEGRLLLDQMPWQDLQNSDFQRDYGRPEKFERYQAEVLVHRHLPVEALQAIITRDAATQVNVEQAVSAAGATISVRIRPDWYP